MSYDAPAEVKTLHFDSEFSKLPSMKGKTVAITGCTSGTGFILAKACVQKGAVVLMLNRPSERATAAKSKLDALEADGKAVLISCDLTSFGKVRETAKTLLADYSSTGIDVLVNNAGVMALTDTATEDGCDIQMQTNHLSHFLLTALVWPLLEKAAELRGEARIVNHSSGARKAVWSLEAKYLAKNGGNLGGNDSPWYYIMPFTGPRWQRYAQTKLANVVFTYALHDKLKEAGKDGKIKALVAHPGLSATNLQVTTSADGGMGAGFTNWFMSRMAQSAEDGTLGIMACCCSPEVKSGEFYGPKSFLGGPAVVIPEESLADTAARKMLWDESVAVTGAEYPF